MCEHDKGSAVPKSSENEVDVKEDFTLSANAKSGPYHWLSGCNNKTGSPDLSQYREHLDGLEIDDEQANELLGILWNIMNHFVDLGFKTDAVSLLLNDTSCGEKTEDSGALEPDSVG